MAKQKYNWTYCKKATNQHPLAIKYKDCIETIDAVSKTEGAKKSPFSDEKCINLDKIEAILAQKKKRNKRKTMDISFGITSGNRKQFLLCEYKLKSKNIINLKKRDFYLKISGSKQLLGHDPEIHNRYLFIFAPKLMPEAKNRLRRFCENRNILDAMDLYDLKRLYFK